MAFADVGDHGRAGRTSGCEPAMVSASKVPVDSRAVGV